MAKVTESDNFIKISAEQSTTEKNIMISGLTIISKPILQVKSKKPIFLKTANAVNKSYPHFYEDFMSLGGKLEVKEWYNENSRY